jgi:hypothetical protein
MDTAERKRRIERALLLNYDTHSVRVDGELRSHKQVIFAHEA